MIYEPNQCPIRFALGAFGDRWSLLIIRDMLFRGCTHFQELVDADEGISTSILANRLQRLEAQQIIARAPDPGDGRQVLYTLTEKGRDLLPVLLALFVWAEKHDPETRVPSDLAAQIGREMAVDHDLALDRIRSALAQPRAGDTAPR